MNVDCVDLLTALQRVADRPASARRLAALAFHWLAHPVVAARAVASSLLHQRTAVGPVWWRLQRSKRTGVNVIGFVDGEFGLGVMARSVLTQLERAGIPFRIVANEVRSHGFVSSRFHALSCEENFSVNLAITTPDRWPLDALRLSAELDLRLPTIGYVAWELEGMPPKFEACLRLFDEVWGISSFCALQVCTPVAQSPRCLPIDIQVPADFSPFEGSTYHLPLGIRNDLFLVGFFFDAASFVERKNPLDVLRAFQAAFPKEASGGLQRQPCLILKTHNTFLAQQHGHWQLVLKAASDDDRVFIVDAKLNSSETWNLMKTLDCYVSLHRAEGLGLTVGEALAMGKPTVCTAYGGVMDYAYMTGFHGVGFEMISIKADQYVGATGLKWAQPDWREAAQIIRTIYDEATHA